MTRILDVLLDLSLLPAGRRIAELGFEEVVAGHRHEADVDVALLAAPDLVDRCPHIVVDAPPREAYKIEASIYVFDQEGKIYEGLSDELREAMDDVLCGSCESACKIDPLGGVIGVQF